MREKQKSLVSINNVQVFSTPYFTGPMVSIRTAPISYKPAQPPVPTCDWSTEARLAVGDRDVGERRIERRASVDTLGDAHDFVVGQRHGLEDASSVKLLVTFRSVCGDHRDGRIHVQREQDQDSAQDDREPSGPGLKCFKMCKSWWHSFHWNVVKSRNLEMICRRYTVELTICGPYILQHCNCVFQLPIARCHLLKIPSWDFQP